MFLGSNDHCARRTLVMMAKKLAMPHRQHLNDHSNDRQAKLGYSIFDRGHDHDLVFFHYDHVFGCRHHPYHVSSLSMRFFL